MHIDELIQDLEVEDDEGKGSDGKASASPTVTGSGVGGDPENAATEENEETLE